MERVIRLSITGRGAGTDAPTVDDLFDQVRDYFDVMQEVEKALAEDGINAIDWRVVSASANSPIELAIAPFPREYAVNIDRRADVTVEAAANGFRLLQEGDEEPPYFSEKAVETAERFFARVMNGLSRTKVDHGGKLPALEVTPENARAAVKHTEAILNPPGSSPYKELGSLEGYVHRVEKDGHGRPIVRIRLRLTGTIIKCFVAGRAREKVEREQIAEVWSGRRILVVGTIHYKAVGRLSHVNATDVRFFRERGALPGLADIEDVGFTGGRRSEDYLELVRDGELS